jgi:Cu+-exporting ATPase
MMTPMADLPTTRGATPTNDPVCGRPVDPNRTGQGYVHEDAVYYFCSNGCLRRFMADPDAFIATQRSEHDADTAD